ncbi:hypothetical protein KPH14_007107 [Odynerus spinipes]|uniref:Vitellogenin domain-containing protein n=1 Tax=Odynerus spinipes TaxID=1348599 RepID=A0AAD9RS10_9HYME|nr:hypothetical protein KPH14_007107 [Odynerus spinipes]
MGLAMNVLTALLVFIAAANAIPAHFPHGKTLVYKYYADIKAGTIEPVPYASQFALDGILYIKHDTTDPTLNNAYYVTLSNVKFGLHNGQATHFQRVDTFHPILEAAKVLQDPFLIVFDESGKFQGVKLQNSESNWSKNVKKAIASMLQLDLSLMQIQTPIKPHSFITMENTIHGECQVAYDVHSIDPQHPESSNVFVVTKLYEPKNCTHFVQRVHDHVDCWKCHVDPEDAMSTASRRVFQIEDQGQEILIKKLIGHGVVNYFPWQARSEAHYILNNQSLVLESVVPQTQVHLPIVNFQGVNIEHDVSFKKAETTDALTGEDLSQGRHVMNLGLLIPKLKKMLIEAADYLEENHLEMKEPDWKHGQTINRLRRTMNYMDLDAFEEVFNGMQDAETPRDVTIRNIFLDMIPTVGTTAGCLFTRNLIRKQKVSDVTAIMMLHKLPMHVKLPNERLLLEMEDLLKFGSNINSGVRVASILCFSRLIHKTFQHEVIVTNPLVDRYLQHFYDHVTNEPTYQMKMVYMMAIKNVKIQNINKILEPIIRGDVAISEKPHHIRVQAIWAVHDTIIKDLRYTHDLLWPILADTSLPLPVRIAAYNVLINQLPHMGRIMNLYWLMVYEKNEHLYNYHVTTIKGLANSVDPCLLPVREMARKILRFTRIRPVTGPLSANYHVDYVNPKYGYGETVKTALILDELTGAPHVGSIDHIRMIGRKLIPTIGVYWSADGLDDIMNIVKEQLLGNVMDVIQNENIRNLLINAAKDMPVKKEIHLDICITMNGQVVQAIHYDKNDWMKVFDVLKDWKKVIADVNINTQKVIFDTFYEMHVPTDMGLPAVLGTKIPTMMSFTLNSLLSEAKMPLNLNLKMDARVWQHGEYAMSIYNPIVDVWHSIRKVMSHDFVLPIDMIIGYNHEMTSLKVTFPRLPVNKLSIGGARTHAKNYVTVTEDETDVLKKSCATCHHHEVVTKGTAHKKYYQNAFDSKDTGLQYSMSIFDCESEVTPVSRMTEWIQALSDDHKNTWNNKIIQWVMGIRQQMVNSFISPEVGSCGSLVKIEPSVVHPTSSVDVNVRFSIEDLDRVHENMHVLSSKRINVHSTVDVRAASTNVTTRSWDVNMNVDTTPGHFNNNFKMQVTRVTPGEKKLKICVDGQKNYPVNTVDPLRLGTTKEETNTKVTLTMGMTDEDKCVRDDTMITMTVKGEMTDEQKKQMSHDSVHGACAQDIQNQLFATQVGHIPKTWNCIRETILHTTMRKYTINVVHKKVPQTIVSNVIMFEDIIRSFFLPHVRYTTNHVESGNIKIIAEYPVGTDHMDVSVGTPIHGYEMVEVPIGDKLWNLLMDNTHFSTLFLQKLVNGQIKLCTVYPQVLLTADTGTIPFTFPHQWTLVSGDYVHHTFAIFAKVVQDNKIAVKMHVGDHVVEIMPDTIKPIVTVDGNILVESIEKGVVVPADEFNTYTFKITYNNEHLVVQSQHVPIALMCTPNSLTINLDTTLQAATEDGALVDLRAPFSERIHFSLSTHERRTRRKVIIRTTTTAFIT